ncbi:ABC transporter permease [Lutimaribacter marinistellae]|uniref:ABC transporter permease n=1 Tax=Lutimaribacter marinistellae TaxID=1820329 RepID=A0ABV7TAC2_9RHOB
MSDVTDATTGKRAPTPDDALRTAESKQGGPVLAADGTPLKRSLARALRMQKLRALALIAPLLIFVLLTFIMPIADMLFRSVENSIVSTTLPYTTETLADWDPDGGDAPGEEVFEALYYDMFIAAEAKEHTTLGTRLNYENTGISSLFRGSGRKVDDVGEDQIELLEDQGDHWEDPAFWHAMMSGTGGADDGILAQQRQRLSNLTSDSFNGEIGFSPGAEIAGILPRTVRAYTAFALFTAIAEGDVVAEEEPWEAVKVALVEDLRTADLSGYSGPGAAELQEAQGALSGAEPIAYRAAFEDIDEDWADTDVWRTIKIYSPNYTSGYFLNAIDMQKGPDGAEARPENQQIYIMLFKRTLFMSLMITGSCILLGYPVAWILANLPARSANMLMILVLLPFWTSLLVRTSAWKVMLQQQGVINDTLVWLGLVADEARLVMINNQFGTIVAMTHILLPFMILPMYSVMQTINPSYLRAAKSLGATNWTAFWRVYFPQSVPGIGAGSILVFILAIGYYITPEIVGGTTGTFISNRIAYHISSSLNWGLAAALGTILLAVVLILYWAYDKIVGIDNVKLG